MAKIQRYDGDLPAFASLAEGTERTVFGGDTQSDDLTDNINDALKRGWADGVNESGYPTEQAFNAAFFVNGLLASYLHQIGVAEYNALQVYYTNSFCNYEGILYQSLTDDNVGNQPDTSSANWRSIYNSPALLGTPTAPTPAANDNSTKIATTAYVDATVSIDVINLVYPIGALFLDSNGTLTPPGQGQSGITWSEVTEAEGHLLVGHSASGDWAVNPGAAAGTLSTTDGHALIKAELPNYELTTSPTSATVYEAGTDGGSSGGNFDAAPLTVYSGGSDQPHAHAMTGIKRYGVKIWKRTA